MSQSTGTATGRQSSTAPALAYSNPQPRLPNAEASPPSQPETFIRRARRVQTGSCTLKIWYLALCTFGRAWVRDTDRVTIRIKRQTLAGELECRVNTIRDRLADLRAAGLIETRRSRYHLEIVVFCEPQPQLRDRAESAPSESAQTGRKAPLLESQTGRKAPPQMGRKAPLLESGPSESAQTGRKAPLLESQTGRKAPPQMGRKAPPPMSSGSFHQEGEEDQPLRPTKKQIETIHFLWTRVERTDDVPKPTTMAEAALLIEALSGERKERTRNQRRQYESRSSQGHRTPGVAATRTSFLNDWTPVTNPDADPGAVTDWCCDVEQIARRGILKIQRSVYIEQGRAVGVTDPEAEIDAIIARSER